MREFNDKFPSLTALPVEYSVIDGFSWSDLQGTVDSVPTATPATK